MTAMTGVFETLAAAPAGRVLFLSGGGPITAGQIVAAADLNMEVIGETAGPVFLSTESAAMFLVGMLVCARLGRELVCPAHLGPAYLGEIGVGDGVFVTDTDSGPAEASRMRPLPQAPSPARAPAVMVDAPNRPLKITFFTSGSSGTPKAVERTLGEIETEVAVLESLWGGAPGPVLGSVTHQHIYGLGFRIVWPVMASRPSADIQIDFWDQLRDRLVPGSVFISSPAHLTRLPNADALGRCRPRRIFSAGGLLPFDAARACVEVFATVPIEVLGSTETSGVAWRRQRCPDELWRPLPSVRIAKDRDGCLTVRSPFIEPGRTIAMGDRIEFVEGDTFRLLGRADRVVKVEGRRVSLTRIAEVLADLEDVDETAVVMLPDRRGWLGAAIVLSPSGASRLREMGAFRLSRHLRRALSGRLDPIERPKFWRFVERLPMNSQGKRVDADVRALFETPAEDEAMAPGVRRLDDREAEIDIRLDPAMTWFGGHFPGEPILPGVAEIHLAVVWSRRVWNWSPSSAMLTRVKFHRILRPEDRTRLTLKRDTARDRLSFRFTVGDTVAGEGIVGGAS
jgi:hypothetical protein